MNLLTRASRPFLLRLPEARLIGWRKANASPCKRGYASSGFAPPALAELTTLSDINSARQWAESFRKSSIPREAVRLSFSRSSGPGGQNVNKVNTKCTTKCPLSVTWIPLWAKKALRQNPAYIASSDSLLLTSTLHRSQAQNVDDCLSKHVHTTVPELTMSSIKLQSLILQVSLSGIKNETSEEQKERVRNLEKIEKARRRREKEYKSKIKQTRKKGNWE
ncbi:hypothetical protein DFH11DRAFT_1851108 [Phellopilus nigrolimitatus]|nr:hypothetical protein DFH11DRAFT_1851108 [Phellopilus nigrolimitatus]